LKNIGYTKKNKKKFGDPIFIIFIPFFSKCSHYTLKLFIYKFIQKFDIHSNNHLRQWKLSNDYFPKWFLVLMWMNKCIKITKSLPTFVIIFFILHKFGVIVKGNCELLIHNILSNAHFVIQIDVGNAFKLISKVINFFCFGQRLVQWIFFSYY